MCGNKKAWILDKYVTKKFIKQEADPPLSPPFPKKSTLVQPAKATLPLKPTSAPNSPPNSNATPVNKSSSNYGTILGKGTRAPNKTISVMTSTATVNVINPTANITKFQGFLKSLHTKVDQIKDLNIAIEIATKIRDSKHVITILNSNLMLGIRCDLSALSKYVFYKAETK
jgi:hypothetical protein